MKDEEEERELKMDREFRKRIHKMLRWIETYPEDQNIKARVFFKGMGYMLWQIRQTSEKKGQECYFEQLMNYAKNFEKIGKAKENGISLDEIANTYIFAKNSSSNNMMMYR